jgi:hypothetical protein
MGQAGQELQDTDTDAFVLVLTDGHDGLADLLMKERKERREGRM